MKYDAIVFDMDGLLVDSEPVWKRSEHAVVRDHGAEVDAPFHLQTVGLSLPAWAARVRAHYGLEASLEDLAEQLIERMLERAAREVHAQPGAAELVEFVAAQQLTRAIASSSPLRLIEVTLGAQPWGGAFRVRCSGEEVVHGKPAPDVYLLAAERLGVDPTRCLALEDSPTGARAAVAAGMTCFAVPDATHCAPAAFDEITPHVYADLHQVLAAVS